MKIGANQPPILILLAVVILFWIVIFDHLKFSSMKEFRNYENNEKVENFLRNDDKVIFHTWCSRKLCSDTAIKLEVEKKKLLFKEGSAVLNSTIEFDEDNLYERSFMDLFYSVPSLLEAQKMVIVTTSYGYPPKFSLTWINSQPWPVFVSTKESNFGVSSEPWGNRGRESASYVRFILLFWDYLPEKVAFIHGHEKAWHQEGYRMSYMLRNICFFKHDYVSLSAFENSAWMPVKGSMSYYNILLKHWHLVQSFLGEFPKKGFKEKCCAQFLVSSKRIKKRPKELYELILEQSIAPRVKTTHKNNKRDTDIGFFWEAIWHYVMGEDSIVNTKRKYGFGIDKDIESGRPLSKRPERTLKNVIACPLKKINSDKKAE